MMDSKAKTREEWATALGCDDPVQPKSSEQRPLLALREAIAIAAGHARPIRRCEIVAIGKAVGRRLAHPVRARLDLPPFDQSAMDGYALAGEVDGQGYRIIAGGRTRAGDDPPVLSPGQAARIATGARMPGGADRVILHEHAIVSVGLSGGQVVTAHADVREGANIRLRGEDVRRGELLLAAGDRINARNVALLAAQGIAAVDVMAAPRVAIASSGNELRQPGEILGASNIFDCNRPMLMALAAQAGADVVDGGCCGDDVAILSALFGRLSRENDLVVISGGSSVGETDLTHAALRKAGAVVRHLKIAMKPGKPALIATLGAATILGLPGNPVAAFVSWYTLGRSILATMYGLQHDVLAGQEFRVTNELKRRPGRAEFVPSRLIRTDDGTMLEFLGPAGSGRLSPLCRGEGFALVEAAQASVPQGNRVTFLPFEGRGMS